MKGRLSAELARGIALALLATCVLVGLLVPFRSDIGLVNAVLLFLLLTVAISAVWGRTVGIVAALLTSIAVNLFFVEPLHSFTVQESRNVLALGIFLAVSIITGTLLAQAKNSEGQARQLQAETEVALQLSHAMSRETEPGKALQVLCAEVTKALAARSAAVLQESKGAWSAVAGAGDAELLQRTPTNEERVATDRALNERSVQVIGHWGLAGERVPRIVVPQGRAGAHPRREDSKIFAPLVLGDRVLGVLRLDGPVGRTPFESDPLRLLRIAASEAAVALQRLQLSTAAAHAEALREADELKATLLASVSHDLRTPVATIKAAITSVLDTDIRWSAEDLDAFYRTIDEQADRLTAVLGAVLDLNRLASGAFEPDSSVVRCEHLLQRAAEVAGPETNGRQLVIEAPSDLRVLVDESLIVQALANLISNSAKYSQPEGTIRLGANEVDGQVVISVEDEGPGIDPADLPHIFEQFYRSPAHRGRVKGSGLGLTIVKGFVEACGGTVEVTSTGEKTRFSLRFPAVTPATVPS
jgi:two-component system sensor histidine kinase KdpD